MNKLFIMLLFLSASTAWAQKDPLPQRFANPVSPAPNVASLGKYGDVPVGKYSGTPEISVPLFEVRVKDFSMNLFASYNAAGIQVSEEADFLGLGWSLNAGGVITQMINDQSDFSDWGYYYVSMPDPVSGISSGSLLSAPDYSMVADCNATIDYQTMATAQFHYHNDVPINCELTANVVDVFLASTPDYDTEPDIFFFNFPGYSGKFFYDQKSHSFSTFDRTNLKIQFLGNTVGWTFTAPDGTVFYFNAIETTHVRLTTTMYNDQPVLSTKTGPDFNTFYLTKVHLTTGEDILFNYTAGTQICNLTKKSSQFKASVGYGQYDAYCKERGTDIFYNDSWYIPLYLSKIRFPQGKLVFNWASRDDIMNGLRLTRIDKYDTLAPATVIATATFENSQYFIGHDSPSYLTQYVGSNCTGSVANDLLFKRLKLMSIQLSNNEKPYVFQYNESVSLPSKLSYAQDYWGYYNGNDNASSLYPDPFKYYEKILDAFFNLYNSYPTYQDRSPNSNTLAWLLTKVTYPSKGSTGFTYENNTYGNYYQDTYNRQPSNAHASGYYSAVYNSTTDHSATFTLDVTQKVLVKVSLPSATSNTDLYSQNAWAQIYNSSNQVIWQKKAIEGAGQVFNCTVSSTSDLVTLGPGTYTILVDKDILNQVCNPSGGTYYSIDVTYTVPPVDTSIKFITGPGARVKRVVDMDGLGHSYEKNFDYEYTTIVNGVTRHYSYGDLMKMPVFFQTSETLGYCGNLGGSSGCTTCSSYVLHGSSYTGISKSAKGSFIGYRQVTEWIGNSSSNAGRTISKFISQSDICQLGNTGPCIEALENGSMTQVDYYNSAGLRVKVDSLQYYQEQRNLLSDYGIRTIVTSPSEVDLGIFVSGATMASLHFYPLKAYRYDLKTKSTSLYDATNNLWVTESSTMDYYANGLVKTQATKASDGVDEIITMRYPQQIASEPYITMASQNRIDPLIQKVVTKNLQDVYQRTSNYTQQTDGDILLSSIADSFNGSSPQPLLNVVQYDNKNNPVVMVDRSGVFKSYVYDNTGTTVTALVENSNNEPVYFNGFEDPAGNTAGGHTGNYSRNNFNKVIDGLINGNHYLLTYWIYNGTSWDFHQSTITASSAQYTISLTGQVDDVRFHAAGGRMTSYTFEQEKGITSTLDSNGKISSYEYDSFNRLKFVKDNDGNILKGYEYHIKD